jgi:two-component system chemotaxis sensor kinase CheA
VSVNEYLNLFLEEAREHLQILNDELLKLEQNPADKGAVDEIFRAAHTLKGMSATMGYEKIAELTHKMENILDELRESKIVFSENLSELLFKCVDALETMVENVATENSEKFNISGILNDLKNFNQKDIGITQNREMGVNNKLELNDYDHNLIKVAQERNFNIYEIKVEIAPECVMKSVRAFMVFNSLEKLGEVVKSVPPVQDIEDEKFEKDFIVVLITDKTQNEIAKVLNQISEVEVKEIGSLGLINGSTPQETNSVQEISFLSKTEDTKKGINNKISQTVRVDISKLDKLMNLVGELVINKTRLEQIFRTNDLSALNETAEQIDRISADLQTVVMDVRMVPIEQVFNRFPRMVRDLAKELGKEINLIMEGKETELDRTVIDEIADPLVHLIRNSIDHGIESLEERRKKGKPAQGTLRLSAKQEGNSIIILVEDDGQGINLEKVKSKALEKGIITTNQLEQMDENSIVDLIFSPGFSTASQITDISGRGVGLDVVRSKIQSLKGNVAVESKEGQGSKFTIKLPLTLAIIQALMVKVGPEIYAIPLANINETTSINLNDIKKVQDQEVMVLRNHVLPLVRLAKVLEVPNMDNYESEELFVVVVRKNNKFIGLIVNELIGQQEIVISSLGKFLNGVPGIAGAAILGDGTVSLILDIGTLF